MVRYRQEVIRQSNYLLLQLAGLRIEQEKWRDAPVVRGPGGKFASPQGLSDEEKRNAEEKGLLERVKDGGKEAVKDITEGTKDFAANLKALLYAIPGNINALIQAIAEKLFGKNKDDEFQQELAKEFSKPLNLPPDKSLKDLDQDIRDAFQDAEEATDKEKAAKAVKKAFAASAQFTGKVLLGALLDVTGSKDSPNYQYGKKFAVEDIQQGREKMLSEDSGWFEKRVGAAQYMYGGFNNGVVETKAFASRWLLPLAIPASSGQSLAIAVAETTIPDIAAEVVDQELEKRGVNGTTRFFTSLAIGIGGGVAAGAAVNKVSDKVLRSAQRGTAAATFREVLFGSPEAAGRTQAHSIGETLQQGNNFIADAQKKITGAVDNILNEITEINRQPKAFAERAQRLMDSLTDDITNFDMSEIVSQNYAEVEAIFQKAHAAKTITAWSVEALKSPKIRSLENKVRHTIDETTTKIIANNKLGKDAKEKVEAFAEGMKRIVSKISVTISPKSKKYLNSQSGNLDKAIKIADAIEAQVDVVSLAWGKLRQAHQTEDFVKVLEAEIKNLKQVQQESGEFGKSMNNVIKKFEGYLDEAKKGNLDIDITEGWPGAKAVEQGAKESQREAFESAQKQARKLLGKPPVDPKDLPPSVTKEIGEDMADIYNIPIDKDTPISLIVNDLEAKHIPGTEMAKDDIAKEVSFMTAGTFTEHGVLYSNVSQEARNKAAKTLKRTFDSVVSQSEEGTVFVCTVQGADSLSSSRLKGYKAMGFSSPKLGNGTMYGVVKNGRLIPATKQGKIIQ